MCTDATCFLTFHVRLAASYVWADGHDKAASANTWAGLGDIIQHSRHTSLILTMARRVAISEEQRFFTRKVRRVPASVVRRRRYPLVWLLVTSYVAACNFLQHGQTRFPIIFCVMIEDAVLHSRCPSSPQSCLECRTNDCRGQVVSVAIQRGWRGGRVSVPLARDAPSGEIVLQDCMREGEKVL